MKQQDNHSASTFVRSPLMTRKEAAEYLGISETTLAIWKCTGRYNLRVIKVGRLVRYRLADLEDFIQRRTVEN